MYYFTTAVQVATNGTANTDLMLLNLHTIAGLRARLRKLVCGQYSAPSGAQIRLRLQRTTTLLTPGTGVTPALHQPDGPAAAAVATSAPTAGVLAAVPLLQLAYNDRGAAMWQAGADQEAFEIVGAAAPNGEVVVNSQATAVSVPVDLALTHSE